jgi:hypothetical protein
MARFDRFACIARPIAAGGALAALAALVPACTGKDPYNPGEPIGAFHVTAKLAQTSCGPTPDPWEFDVHLRHDATTLYWVQGGLPVSGKIDASHATLSASVSTTLRDANAKTKLPACVVTRADTVEVSLEQGDGPASDPSTADAFTGSIAYKFQPSADSDCSDQLTETGGDFAALPCDVSYTLVAKRTGTLPK